MGALRRFARLHYRAPLNIGVYEVLSGSTGVRRVCKVYHHVPQ